MSDLSAGVGNDAPAAPAGDSGTDTGASQVPVQAAAAAAASQAPETDPWDTETVQTFDRTYVKKLRDEAAGHRTALAPFKDAFGQYAAEDQAAWFEMAKTLAADPAKGAEMMESVIANIRKGLTPDQAKVQAEAEVNDDAKPLTAAQVNSMIDKARNDDRAKAELDAATGKIIDEAAGLGYAKGTYEFRELLARAQNDHGGDLKAAHAAVEARNQGIIDKAMGKKATQAGPKPVSQAGASPSGKKIPTTLREASDALRARLEAEQIS